MNRADFPAFSAVDWEGIRDDVRDYARWFMMEFFGDDPSFPGYGNIAFSLVDTGIATTTPMALSMNFGKASDFVSGELLKGGLAKLAFDPQAYWSSGFLDFLKAAACSSEQAYRALKVLEDVLTVKKAEGVLAEFGFEEDSVWGLSKNVGDEDEDFMVAQVIPAGRSVDVKLHVEDEECDPILTVRLRASSVENLRVAVAAALGPWLESRGFQEKEKENG